MNDETRGKNPVHLVLLVHGINTRARWIGEIKPVLKSAGFVVEATSYGEYGVLRFLLPFPWLRKIAIERVVRAISAARMLHSPDKMSVISHSFGTFVIAKILADHPEFTWHRIVFCGSVVRDDFRLDLTLNRFRQPLLNEVGSRDFLPALAESVTWGYGSVGSNGYNDVGVDTRWHTGVAHSGFLNKDFCQKFWIPFLNEATVIAGDAPSELAWWIRLITALPLRWLQPVILVLLLFVLASFMPGDPPAKADETAQTRVTSFILHRQSESFEPGDRFWTRPVPDRWTERYPSGLTSNFRVVRRSSNSECNGTIVENQADPNLQLFIPDKECDRMVIAWRRRSKALLAAFTRSELKWTELSSMIDVK
jgi:pimeloyl-ACP methyl ester carboxylesterase